MATEKGLQEAKALYEQVCEVLDSINLRYQKVEDDFIVHAVMMRKNALFSIHIVVDIDRKLIRACSIPAVEFCKEKRIDAALAICGLNDRMADGCFVFDATDGSVLFRAAMSYRESLIGEEAIVYLFHLAKHMAEKYSPRLEQLDSGSISLEEFLERE